jgi:hypothetical protein
MNWQCFSSIFQVLVIIDAKPKDLGLPTEAYIAVEEVHDVRFYSEFYVNFKNLYSEEIKFNAVYSDVTMPLTLSWS